MRDRQSGLHHSNMARLDQSGNGVASLVMSARYVTRLTDRRSASLTSDDRSVTHRTLGRCHAGSSGPKLYQP